MIPDFAKRVVKSSLDTFGYSLHDLRKNNDLRVFLPGHLRDILTKLQINCVIDVGANVGQYGLMLRRIGYQGRIVSIEPTRESFETLSETAEDDPDWMTLNTACGNQDGTMSINIFAESHINSLLHPSPNIAALASRPIQRTDTVTVKRLESIMGDALIGIDEPHVFLKTDTQGFDLDVLRGVGELINQVKGLQSEISVIPLYVGAPDYLEFLS